MRVANETISALTNIITGNTVTGNRSISPYRSGPQLIAFFNQFGWNDEYAQGFPSRHVYVDMNLRQANGTDIMNQIVVAAVDPRRFLGTELSVEEVVNYLNQFLAYDGYELVREGLHYQVHRTPLGQEREGARIKNIIFAANGPKPEIVLVDAINNDIAIVRHAQFRLVYEKEITDNGLLWREMVQWWAEQANLANFGEDEQATHLRTRLEQSLGSEPEQILFSTYYDTFLPQLGEGLPALIPQVGSHAGVVVECSGNLVARS